MLRATQIRRLSQGLQFSWSDQSQSEIPLGWLRRVCGCAVCLERGAESFPLFSSKAAMDAAFSPKEILPVGNYGFEVVWQDGHRSIYDFERVKTAFESMGLPPHLKSVGVSGEAR